MEKKGLSLRAKSWIAVCLFAVVFAGLATLASFYDLQISKLLTKHSLDSGEYISHSGFALFFEAIGSAPLYLMVAVVGLIWFWAAWRKGGKWRIAACFSLILTVGGITMVFKDAFSYVAEYLGAQLGDDALFVLASKKAAGSMYILGLSFVFGAVGTFLSALAWKHIKPEINDKMVWWAFAILCAVAFYLVVHFVKGPVGRVRFRSMNYVGNFDAYTPWYVANGKRDWMKEVYNVAIATDNAKSFPSGHTFSAAMVYSLLAIPYLDDKLNKKGVKIAVWCSCIAYVAVVAISRIVAGAHYFSDVLFGGTIGFVGAIIGREIFVCKGSHFKAMFGIKGKSAQDKEQPQKESEQPLSESEPSEQAE